MNINEFVRERKEDWQRLESLSRKLGAMNAGGLSPDEVWELSRLYTGAVADLALLKSADAAMEPRSEVLQYLNGLVIAVHGRIYRRKPFAWSAVLEFLIRDVPRAVRSSFPYIGTAFGIFFFFGVVGFILSLRDPTFIELFLPDRIIQTVEKGEVWFEGLYGVAPAASTHLMQHNISVVFLSVALGITFGIGTAYLMALNGLLIGTVAALCFIHGLSLEFWSFVIPHGSLELSAIWLSGGAGLMIGYALIDPGQYSRAHYLAVQGRRAAKTALAAVPLLVGAGIIEAFFSPSPLSPWLKIGFGTASFCALMTFFTVAGRGAARRDDEHEYHERGLSWTFGANTPG